MNSQSTHRTILYDIEIANAVPARYASPLEGVTYCKGWHDFKGMGIACVGVLEYVASDVSTPLETIPTPRVFYGDDIHRIPPLFERADMVVGFNSKRFDDKLLAANGVKVKTDYDVLIEIWRAVGALEDSEDLETMVFDYHRHGGYGLDEVASSNGLGRKALTGAEAPIRWQKGDYAKVISYCLQDVAMTARILDCAIRRRSLTLRAQGGGRADFFLEPPCNRL